MKCISTTMKHTRQREAFKCLINKEFEISKRIYGYY